MTEYPVGNQVTCLFAFTNRELTDAEEATFLAGGGLPNGVGVDQTSVDGFWNVNDGPWTTVSSVTHVSTGAYSMVITLTVPNGRYKYYGQSYDGSSNLVAATASNVITALPH